MIWQIDPTNSHVSFAIRVMSVSTTRGHICDKPSVCHKRAPSTLLLCDDLSYEDHDNVPNQ